MHRTQRCCLELAQHDIGSCRQLVCAGGWWIQHNLVCTIAVGRVLERFVRSLIIIEGPLLVINNSDQKVLTSMPARLNTSVGDSQIQLFDTHFGGRPKARRTRENVLTFNVTTEKEPRVCFNLLAVLRMHVKMP